MAEKRGESRTLIAVAIITGIFGIGSAIVTGLFALKASESKNQIINTNTALAQEVTNGNATQSSLRDTLTAPTATQIFTKAPQPTLTPSPTFAPSLLSFHDDFENGIKPDWQILYGNIGMANGNFTVLDPFNKTAQNYAAIVGGYPWKNARISITMEPFRAGGNCGDIYCAGNAAAGIILRYQSGAPSIGLLIFWPPNNINPTVNYALGTFDESSGWSIITSTKVEGDYWIINNQVKIVIDAVGDTYAVYQNGQKLTSATISGAKEGFVGLWFKTSNSNDSIEGYAPRFEDFQVQELP